MTLGPSLTGSRLASAQVPSEGTRSGAQGISSGTRRAADFDVEVAAHGPGHEVGPGPKGGRASQPDGHDDPGSHHHLEGPRAEQQNAGTEHAGTERHVI